MAGDVSGGRRGGGKRPRRGGAAGKDGRSKDAGRQKRASRADAEKPRGKGAASAPRRGKTRAAGDAAPERPPRPGKDAGRAGGTEGKRPSSKGQSAATKRVSGDGTQRSGERATSRRAPSSVVRGGRSNRGESTGPGQRRAPRGTRRTGSERRGPRAEWDPLPSYLTERQTLILHFIADFREEHGYSPTHREICERFGYSSYGTVYKHLKLLQQKGYLHRDWNQKRGLELARPVPGRPLPDEPGVPFLGFIAAGRPIETLPGDERIEVPTQLFSGPRRAHYVLRVAGSSMVDEGIQDGDLVVVLQREEARTGEMVVALVGGDATLKRFYPEGKTVRLQPANPTMDPLRVPADQVRIQGVVVGLMRRY